MSDFVDEVEDSTVQSFGEDLPNMMEEDDDAQAFGQLLSLHLDGTVMDNNQSLEFDENYEENGGIDSEEDMEDMVDIKEDKEEDNDDVTEEDNPAENDTEKATEAESVETPPEEQNLEKDTTSVQKAEKRYRRKGRKINYKKDVNGLKDKGQTTSRASAQEVRPSDEDPTANQRGQHCTGQQETEVDTQKDTDEDTKDNEKDNDNITEEDTTTAENDTEKATEVDSVEAPPEEQNLQKDTTSVQKAEKRYRRRGTRGKGRKINYKKDESGLKDKGQTTSRGSAQEVRPSDEDPTANQRGQHCTSQQETEVDTQKDTDEDTKDNKNDTEKATEVDSVEAPPEEHHLEKDTTLVQKTEKRHRRRGTRGKGRKINYKKDVNGLKDRGETTSRASAQQVRPSDKALTTNQRGKHWTGQQINGQRNERTLHGGRGSWGEQRIPYWWQHVRPPVSNFWNREQEYWPRSSREQHWYHHQPREFWNQYYRTNRGPQE